MNILYFILPVMLMTAGGAKPTAPKAKLYYFCYSKPMSAANQQGKKYFLYTKIQEAEGTLTAHPSAPLVAWRQLVDKNCKNGTGCSSDVNWYETLLEAKQQLASHIREKQDTAHYQFTRLTFYN
jgi:hypothetical protein